MTSGTLNASGSANPAFSAVTTGTNTTAVLGVGTGASMNFVNNSLYLNDGAAGLTALNTANAGASNYTITFPAITDTVTTLAATQTLTNKTVSGANVAGTLSIAGNLWESTTTLPTMTSGWGTGAAITASSTKLFKIIVGTGSPTTSVIALPAATNDWKCDAKDYTKILAVATPSGETTTSHTWTWNISPDSGDVVMITCEAM